MRTAYLAMLSMIFLLPLATFADDDHAEAKKQATAAAEAWLKLTDAGMSEQAWEQSSHYLKDAATKEDFAKGLKAARQPLGKVKSRELMSQTYETMLPGAPDGEYVVIQFKTSFENKQSAVETITPMLDKDKKWRVSGYYIK
jgi:hypothetical protein